MFIQCELETFLKSINYNFYIIFGINNYKNVLCCIVTFIIYYYCLTGDLKYNYFHVQ